MQFFTDFFYFSLLPKFTSLALGYCSHQAQIQTFQSNAEK